jgi:hypothetical protein
VGYLPFFLSFQPSVVGNKYIQSLDIQVAKIAALWQKQLATTIVLKLLKLPFGNVVNKYVL